MDRLKYAIYRVIGRAGLTRKLGPAGRAAADPGRCGGEGWGGGWVVRRVAGVPGRRLRRVGGSGPGVRRAGQAASAGVPGGGLPGGGLMVMVTVQPGWSFWSRRSR